MSWLTVVIVLVAAVLVFAVVYEIALGYPKRAFVPSLLSGKEQAIVAAAADALFPAGGPIPVSGSDAGLVGYIDGYVRRSPPRYRSLIRLLFAFIELVPWVLGPRRTRFTRLAQADREETLARLARSDVYFLRAAFLSLRTMLSMGYIANDAVARAIGVVADQTPFEPPARSSGASIADVSAPAGQAEAQS